MIARREWFALGTAALIAIAFPLLMLQPGAEPARPPGQPAARPLSATPLPPLAVAYRRPLFGAPAPEVV